METGFTDQFAFLNELISHISIKWWEMKELNLLDPVKGTDFTD